MKILIAEDDLSINTLLAKSLKKHGYHPIPTFDGLEACNVVEAETIDFAIIDIMLPKINGWELFEYLKEFNIPTIFLTAKDQPQDKIKGLTLGADDYMTKPFDILELIARIETIRRRIFGTNASQTLLRLPELEVDTFNKKVTFKNKNIPLTPKEFQLLCVLVAHNKIVLSREQLYQIVWRKEFNPETRTLDLHIQHLRQKMFQTGELSTIYGLGYVLEL